MIKARQTDTQNIVRLVMDVGSEAIDILNEKARTSYIR